MWLPPPPYAMTGRKLTVATPCQWRQWQSTMLPPTEAMKARKMNQMKILSWKHTNQNAYSSFYMLISIYSQKTNSLQSKSQTVCVWHLLRRRLRWKKNLSFGGLWNKNQCLPGMSSKYGQFFFKTKMCNTTFLLSFFFQSKSSLVRQRFIHSRQTRLFHVLSAWYDRGQRFENKQKKHLFCCSNAIPPEKVCKSINEILQLWEQY